MWEIEHIATGMADVQTEEQLKGEVAG